MATSYCYNFDFEKSIEFRQKEKVIILGPIIAQLTHQVMQ